MTATQTIIYKVFDYMMLQECFNKLKSTKNYLLITNIQKITFESPSVRSKTKKIIYKVLDYMIMQRKNSHF